MKKINPFTTVLGDCSTLSSSIKDKYLFKGFKQLVESKYKYKFTSTEEKEVVREFYDRFCCNRKEA